MANAAVVYSNMADSATVSASSQETSLPASNLLTAHVSERWRSLTNSDYVVIDKGSTTAADTVMIRGMTSSAAGTARLRLSSSDATGAAGDILDTGTLSDGGTYSSGGNLAAFDLGYGAIVALLASTAGFRYVRLDQADSGGTYVEAGAACIGARTAFTYNFVPGASLGWVDRSRRAITSGGQTLIWVDNSFRRLVLNFEWVTSTQRYGLIESMDRINGQRKNVLVIIDTASTNLARDSIFGLISDLTPVSTPAIIDIFGKQIQIDERL